MLTIVAVRPKYYIGSSGSIRASETMLLRIRRELPQLFEVSKGPYRYSSIHDCLYYFQDTSMYEDIMAATQKPNCNFRKYEMMRWSWLRRELNAAMLRWDEDKIGVKGEDVAYGNEVKDAVVSVIDHLEQDFTDITVTGEQLWEVYGVLQRKVDHVLKCINVNELKLPPVKTDILKNTPMQGLVWEAAM